jgi:hypothetical protein
MNLINEKVEHITFKGGEIVQQESNHVIIQFSAEYGTKRFVYPDAFKKFVELQNKKLQEEVLGELNVKQTKIDEEKEIKLQEYRDRAESAKLALKSIKKKSTKKVTKSKLEK